MSSFIFCSYVLVFHTHHILQKYQSITDWRLKTDRFLTTNSLRSTLLIDRAGSIFPGPPGFSLLPSFHKWWQTPVWVCVWVWCVCKMGSLSPQGRGIVVRQPWCMCGWDGVMRDGCWSWESCGWPFQTNNSGLNWVEKPFLPNPARRVRKYALLENKNMPRLFCNRR